ncbi:MAG: von Willebrand factor type A domain-containing protein [candidate division Zixibacteria bacterium]|nr:von Willebrand factor type A domain-containing protein [candidate division Zixibacteria bacterium]
MRHNIKLTLAVLALVSLMAAAIILADATGQISGRIIDSHTGLPIVGATVLVVGTNRGANTDLDGKFVIPKIAPGTYTLRISSIGFQTLEVKNVIVEADLTVEINNSLTQGADGLKEKIVVEAKIDIMDKFETSNQTIITKKMMEQKTMPSVDDLIEQVAGVVTDSEGKVFIRGGRASETSYIMDGVPKNSATANLNKVPRLKSVQPFPPAHGGTAIVNGKPYDAMFFENYGVNPFVDTEDDHFSTFAVDVDDASYILARAYLERGNLPEKDAVRTEEFINHFNYNYNAPEEETFAVYLEGSRSPFGRNSQMLRIGIKGKKISEENRKAANLVFLVDVSGSMARENRIGLVRKALRLLVNKLNYNDQVGIVVYGSTARVHLQPTSIRDKERILYAIMTLGTSGSTNCEAGLRLAYDMSSRHFQKNKINRIILCSDGVANVGITAADELLETIKEQANRGITLSAIGFGMGNYNDVLMEKLGNKGNGYYAYVDDITEARRVFTDNLTGALQVIARDVKIQVDFDPEVVRSYRLLGYENRDVEDNKFRDDNEDGGEIGSGHSVTALYEIKFKKDAHKKQIGKIYIRYKNPETGFVEEINRPIAISIFDRNFAFSSPDYKLAAAAAEFSEIMRQSYWARGSDLGDVLSLAGDVYNQTGQDDVLELMNLVTKARQLKQELASNDFQE